MSEGTEPSNAQILTLLSQHISDTQAARTEAARSISDLGATVKTVVNEMGHLRARIERVELEREETHRVARKALDSSHDLEGVVLREVSALQASNREQNTALAKIVVSTRDIIADSEARKVAALARDKTIDRIDKLAKATVSILGILALGWGFLEFIVKHWK